jgi:hypothetical protein
MAKKTTGSPAPRTPAAPRRRSTPAAAAPRRASAAEPAAAPIDIATAGPTEAPTHDDIAHAAYLRYLSRGGGDGQDFDDWLHAEQELKKRNNGG